MNFNDYIKQQLVGDHESLRSDASIENEIGVNSVLRRYPIKSTEQIVHKISSLIPAKFHFDKKPEISEIGRGTFLVKTPDFEKAFEVVSKKLGAKKPEEVKWVRVFQNRFEAGKLSKDVVGYKFFVDENFYLDEDELEPILEQDYIPIDVNDYVIGAIRNNVPHLKLISILNDDISITKHLIFHVAEKLGVRDLSKEKLKNILHDMNTWVPIEEYDENAPKKESMARILVRIVDNNTKAFLRIDLTKGGIVPTVDAVIETLKKRDIVFGIDREAITDLIRKRNFRHEILAVKGIEPVQGKPGYIEETAVLRTEAENKKDLDKNIRFFTPFVAVKKGEAVLRIVRGVDGVSGRDVFNRTIEVDTAEAVLADLKIGNNLHYDENKEYVIASISGNLAHLRNGVWNVEKVLELAEIGPHTGNITHLGSVVVSGSIQDGFNLVATGNVRVLKSVGSCRVEAGGDIDIFLGMNGKNKGKLISHFGSIIAKFIVDCDVLADRDVKVDELLANCNVECGNVITAIGLRSSIWGGFVNAYKSIIANNIGSVAERKTDISVGIQQPLRIKIKQNSILQQTKKDELRKINENLNSKTNESQLNASERKEYEKNAVLLREELRELEATYKELMKEKSVSNTAASITVRQTLYGNVTVHCNRAKLVNRRYRKSVVLTQDQNSLDYLKIMPYVLPGNIKQAKSKKSAR